MRPGLVCLLVTLTGAAPAVAVEIEQATTGWCSPIQSGNNNNFTCNGVDPRAEHYLNDLLDRMKLDLTQKTARKYNELNAQLEETKKQLAAKGEDATLVQTTQDLLHAGKLEEARAIFDRLIKSDEANVDRAAQDHFGRANVFELQFRPDEALLDYAQAYQYRPQNLRYAEGYAFALLEQRDYAKAESVLQELLRQRRRLAEENPAVYQPDLAQTLNNLGVLYGDNPDRFADAESALKELVDIERELAEQNPTAYRPELAGALNNLGVFYLNTRRFAEAEGALKEAVDIWGALAAQNSAYRPQFAATLNHLGALYSNNPDRFADAETVLKEAAGIDRQLAEQNPAAYRANLAAPLNNLGVFYLNTRRFDDGERALKEAVDIERELAKENPAAYQPELAETLNNLGLLYSNNPGRLADAETALKEAADIWRALAVQNPAVYRFVLRATLNNLASLYRDMHRDGDANAIEAEARAAAK